MIRVPRTTWLARRVRAGRKTGDPQTALRFLAVARPALGKNQHQVAAELELAVFTVGKAAGRFVEHGESGLVDGRRSNGHRKADSRFDTVLSRVLRYTPQHYGWERPTWTRDLLCQQMRIEGFADVAVCTMGRALARIGARLSVPKPIVVCPWSRDARLRVLARIKRLC
jgi:hypothetical protein